MKHISESIRKHKNEPNLNIFLIPGTITFNYETEDTTWYGKDQCDGWYLIADPEMTMFILWSAKSKYYPYIYAEGLNAPEWSYSWLDKAEWGLIETDLHSKTPREIYDFITDYHEFDGYVEASILNVYVNIPDKVKKLIGQYLGI